MSIEGKIYNHLKEKNLKITTAESCTGGMVASRLVNISGISEYFEGGYVTYSDRTKVEYLNVPQSVIDEYTAVSKQTARKMARGAAKKMKADIAVSVTGVAGPDDLSKDKKAGLVYIGCYYKGRSVAKEYHFSGDRNMVRRKSCKKALKLVLRVLEEDNYV